jgi:hypothetical protein
MDNPFATSVSTPVSSSTSPFSTPRSELPTTVNIHLGHSDMMLYGVAAAGLMAGMVAGGVLTWCAIATNDLMSQARR